MVKKLPAGFNAARIREGLITAMEFGAPTRTEDRATFFFERRGPVAGRVDEDGVPFDPTLRPANTASPTKVTVPCAVEFYNGASKIETFGEVKATRISVTLLDKEWQIVKDFRYVVAGGDKYLRDIKEPGAALGSLDVHTVWCVSEDER